MIRKEIFTFAKCYRFKKYILSDCFFWSVIENVLFKKPGVICYLSYSYLITWCIYVKIDFLYNILFASLSDRLFWFFFLLKYLMI